MYPLTFSGSDYDIHVSACPFIIYKSVSDQEKSNRILAGPDVALGILQLHVTRRHNDIDQEMRNSESVPPRRQTSENKKRLHINDKSSMQSKSSASMHSLFVHGLPLLMESETLRQFFSQFGPVNATTRVIRNKGYGFVDFATAEGLEAALAAAASTKPLMIDGLCIRVDRVRGEAGETTSGFGGSWATSSTSSLPPTPTGHSSAKNDSFESFNQGNSKGEVAKEPEGYVAMTSVKRESHDKRLVVIREVPPETTLIDLQKILSAYGAVRSLVLRSEPSGALVSVASTTHFVTLRFAQPKAVLAAKSACDQESTPAKVSDIHTLDIGPYSLAPSLVDIIEFMSTFGELLSGDLIRHQTSATVLFEYESSAEVALKAPLYSRGSKMLLERPSQSDASLSI